MALDNITLKTITKRLLSELDGAFLEKPYSLSYSTIAIPYHSGGNEVNKGRGTLILELGTENPFVVYSYDKFTKINDNSAFLNSLRRIQGTRVRNVKKSIGERVLTISLEVRDDAIDVTDTGYDLVIELFPMHPNVYLIPYPSAKVFSVYKEKGDISAKNYNGRGMSYTYPITRTEVSEDIANIEDMKTLLSRATYKHFEKYASEVGFKKALFELVESDKLYLIDEKIEPLNFNLAGATNIEIQDIYSHYVTDQRRLARLLKEKDLINTVDRALKIATKKLSNLEKDSKDADKHLVYMEYGQLLYMAQSEYQKGMKEMEVEGIKIALDPKLSLPENANRYFKKYRKAKQAVTTLKELIIKTKDEITYLNKKKLDIENGSARDLQELKEELVMTGYIKGKPLKNGRKKKAIKKSYEPHYIEIEGGKIGFGLNDLQNETLTFEIARKDSLFFHVKDHPGSHVLVLQGQNDNKVKTLASELALFLSHLSEGDVYVAQKQYVKKNKEKRGLVNILEFQTYTIRHIRESSIALFKKILKEE